MKDEISIEDFVKLDLRVGEVVKAEEPVWSNKLVRLTVDLGEEIGERIILAGIKGEYEMDDLVGVRGVFVVNLAPKRMGEEESQGMMLMSDTDEKPVPIDVGVGVAKGTVVR